MLKSFQSDSSVDYIKIAPEKRRNKCVKIRTVNESLYGQSFLK